jgi:hypothetical protein
MQHPLARAANDFMMSPGSMNEDEAVAAAAAAAAGAANMLGLVSRASFLPAALHRHHEAFERPKFMPSPTDKDFFRLKAGLDSDNGHHHVGNNNKMMGFGGNGGSGMKQGPHSPDHYNDLKGKKI